MRCLLLEYPGTSSLCRLLGFFHCHNADLWLEQQPHDVLFDFLCGKDSPNVEWRWWGEPRVPLCASWSPIPCLTIHLVTHVTSERRAPITRPRYKERTYLSTSNRMAFQQRNGPSTAEILVIHMISKLCFGSVNNPGTHKLLAPH